MKMAILQVWLKGIRRFICPTEKWRSTWIREMRFVFLVFFLSRLLIFSSMAVSPLFIAPATNPGKWDLPNPLLRPLFRWDAGWYLSIAMDGYTYNGNPSQEQNIGFFPLYPLTCRLCHAVTGLPIPLCAVLLSNLAFLIGLTALYTLIRWETNAEIARSATLLLAFFPASFFFSTMYTESFYLAFSVLAYSSFRKQRTIQGGVWAGLASATRVIGILLFVPLLCENLPCLKDRRIRWRFLLASLLTASGIGAFMIYQWIVFGDPLAYFRIQRQVIGWRGGFTLPFRRTAGAFVEIIRGPFSSVPFDAFSALGFIALACKLPPNLPRSYSVYTLLGVAVPLFTAAGPEALTRYVSVLFPGFMALGIIGRRSRWINWALLAFFAVLLVCFSAYFAQWYWIG